MKPSTFLTSLIYLTTFTSTTALPPVSPNSDSTSLLSIPDPSKFDPTLQPDGQHQQNSLEKRRGGGGGKGGGGGRGGSGSGSGGSRSPGPSNSFSSSSNLGGRTRDGSGTPPAYGSNRYYGGAAVPFTAGARRGNLTPFLLPVGALAFFPALWLFPGIYAYPFVGYGGYHWLDQNGRNRTANVTCLCQEYSVCGCDDPSNANSGDGGGNSTVIAQQLTDGKGSGAPVNSTRVRVVDYGDGNTTAYINGTLENGTTAAGGTDPSNEAQFNGVGRVVVEFGGYWIMVVVVGMLVNVV